MKSIWERVKIRLGLYQRRFVHDPLRTVPEFSGQITWEMQSQDGNRALCYQAIAEQLLFGVEYVVEASVGGDIVEFGCMTGRTANVIAAAMASSRANRGLHLFLVSRGCPNPRAKRI